MRSASSIFPWVTCAAVLLLLACEQRLTQPLADADDAPKPQAGKDDAPKQSETKMVKLGNGVWFENQGDKRRVHVEAVVCSNDWSFGLECLLCRKKTKDYESILSTEAKAQVIHAALVAAGAKPGSTVQFEPMFKPPSGSVIKITLQYEEKGKVVTVPAQQWLRNVKTEKNLEGDWVFAGSAFYPDLDDKKNPPIYAADSEGAYICTTNVSTAMLDLPIASPRGIEDRIFTPDKPKIPPLETKVTIILEPVADAKK